MTDDVKEVSDDPFLNWLQKQCPSQPGDLASIADRLRETFKTLDDAQRASQLELRQKAKVPYHIATKLQPTCIDQLKEFIAAKDAVAIRRMLEEHNVRSDQDALNEGLSFACVNLRDDKDLRLDIAKAFLKAGADPGRGSTPATSVVLAYAPVDAALLRLLLQRKQTSTEEKGSQCPTEQSPLTLLDWAAFSDDALKAFSDANSQAPLQWRRLAQGENMVAEPGHEEEHVGLLQMARLKPFLDRRSVPLTLEDWAAYSDDSLKAIQAAEGGGPLRWTRVLGAEQREQELRKQLHSYIAAEPTSNK